MAIPYERWGDLAKVAKGIEIQAQLPPCEHCSFGGNFLPENFCKVCGTRYSPVAMQTAMPSFNTLVEMAKQKDELAKHAASMAHVSIAKSWFAEANELRRVAGVLRSWETGEDPEDIEGMVVMPQAPRVTGWRGFIVNTIVWFLPPRLVVPVLNLFKGRKNKSGLERLG